MLSQQRSHPRLEHRERRPGRPPDIPRRRVRSDRLHHRRPRDPQPRRDPRVRHTLRGKPPDQCPVFQSDHSPIVVECSLFTVESVQFSSVADTAVGEIAGSDATLPQSTNWDPARGRTGRCQRRIGRTSIAKPSGYQLRRGQVGGTCGRRHRKRDAINSRTSSLAAISIAPHQDQPSRAQPICVTVAHVPVIDTVGGRCT